MGFVIVAEVYVLPHEVVGHVPVGTLLTVVIVLDVNEHVDVQNSPRIFSVLLFS